VIFEIFTWQIVTSLQVMEMNTLKNPNCKKVRGSHVLAVSCAYCKTFIAHYQKVGESNLVKMYNDRIIDGVLDFSQYRGAIFCPKCNERIATRYITKRDKKEAYRLVPSAFNKRKI
jgi:recombinational DNA repair protein (RecF pathway)